MTISFDISTSCVGYAVFNNGGTLLELDYVKFNSKQSVFEKLETFKERIRHLFLLSVNYIAIEQPLERMQGKFSSSHTIAILNFFNGMVSSILYDKFKIEPVYYNVNNARKTVFPDLIYKKDSASRKRQIWEEVVKMEPQINWKYGIKSRKLLDENFDMSDAYVAGKTHLILLEKQRKKI